MRATIASSAATKNAAATKKRITKDTLGGLIQIQEYEIVATHLGARSERATILIKDFKSIGSEGSGGFGCPRPLESLPEIVDLLDQLKALRIGESRENQLRSSLGSPVEGTPSFSQLGSEGFGHRLQETNQSMFATQIPSRFSNSSLVAEREAQRQIVSKSEKVQQRQGHPLENAEPKANGKRKVNTSEALLALLAPKRAVTRPEPSQNTTNNRDSAQLPNSEGESRKKSSVSEEAIDGVDLSISSGPTAEDHRQEKVVEAATNQPLPTHVTSEPVIPSGITKEDSLSAENGYSVKESHHTNHSEEVAIPTVHTYVPNSSKRICSRDIRISKDQQVLLDRPDSWLPAEPGQRGPVTNVPIATLQALNRRVELIAHRLSSSPDHKTQENASDSMSTPAIKSPLFLKKVHNVDSDSETPFSSAEWPASSQLEVPDNELPPDSSMESVGKHDSGIGRDAEQFDRIPQARRLSTTSVSSTPTRSTRKNPKRTPKALQSTARSSPSLISLSADEEAKRFKCLAPGCPKAYMVASGLRYHLEHAHAATKLKESPKRTGNLKPKARGKSRTTYICITCHHHFDTEKELSHHQELDACSEPGPEVLQRHDSLGGGMGQLPTTSERAPAIPVHDNGVNDLRQDAYHNGPTSIVWRLGESSPASPSLMYVSPYMSPRLGGRVSGNPKTSPKSTSAQRIVLQSGVAHPNISHHDKKVPHRSAERSNSLKSEISSADTDLETMIPRALNEAKDLHSSNAPLQLLPSTAIQPEEPFTQVKRTPYINGSLPDKVNLHPVSPPSHSRRVSAAALTVPNRIREQVAPSHSPMLEVASTKPPIDQPTASEYRFVNVTAGELGEAIVVDQERSKVDGQSQKSGIVESPFRKRKISSIDNILLRPGSESTSTESSPLKDKMSMLGSRNGSEMKPGSFEHTLLSQNVVKRRKHLNASKSFGFSQDIQVVQDPSILARAYRQEFLASRKSSTSEQSDNSRRTLYSSEKNESGPVIQQNRQMVVSQDGDALSEPEACGISTDIDASVSAPSPLGNPSPLTREIDYETAFAQNNDDIATSVEDQRVPMNPGISSSEQRNDNVSGTFEIQDNDGNITVSLFNEQKGLNLDVGDDYISATVEGNQVSNANPALRAKDQSAGAELIPRLVNHYSLDNTGIGEEAASLEAQAGQGLQDQANESLLSEQRSEIGSNRVSFRERSMQAPEVMEKTKLPDKPDVVMAHVDPQVPTDGQNAVLLENTSVQPFPTKPATMFEKFKTTYPEYVGTEEHFVAICKKINLLFQQDRMEHRSLWDDFIIRHAIEYPQYLQRCALKAEDPLPYERFYRNEIEEPEFTKRIVTPKNLAEILGTGDLEKETILRQQQPHQQAQRSDNSIHHNISVSPVFKSPTKPASAAVSSPKLPFSPATIDLTNDSEDSTLIEDGPEPVRSSQKRPRPLPWVEQNRDNDSSPPKRRSSTVMNTTPFHVSSPSLRPALEAASSIGQKVSDASLKAVVANSPAPLPRTSIRLKPKPVLRPIGRGTSSKLVDTTKPSSVKTSLPTTKEPKDTATTDIEHATTKKAEYWKDTDSPFKKFANAYGAIRPGKGNSYAVGGAKGNSTVKDMAEKNF